MNVFAKIWVNGVVQGVGFRYFVSQTASSFKLNGNVKNLPDGRVFIKIEGEKTTIIAFIKEIRIGNRWSHVTNIDVEWSEQTKNFQSFEIVF